MKLNGFPRAICQQEEMTKCMSWGEVGFDAGRQKPLWAVEVKWSDRYVNKHPGELVSLLSYMPRNGLNEAIATSETATATKEMDDVTLHFIPVACYAYTVAANTLRKTRTIYGL